MVVTLIPGLMSGTWRQQPRRNRDRRRPKHHRRLIFSSNSIRATRNQSIPTMLRAAYAQQILDQMIFQRALEYEAGRMGLRVTPEEETQRIKEILPDAWSGNTWLKDQLCHGSPDADGNGRVGI